MQPEKQQTGQEQEEIQFRDMMTPGDTVSPIGEGLNGPFEFKSGINERHESDPHLMTGEFINNESGGEIYNRYPSSLENPPRHEGAASILKKRLA